MLLAALVTGHEATTNGAGPPGRRHQRGQGLVEYSLILVLIAVVTIAVLQITGHSVFGVFQHVNSCLTTNSSGGGGCTTSSGG